MIDLDSKPTAHDTPVSAIMTTNVVCVAPDLSVDTLITLMLERGFSGAPVVGPDGKAIGVVSKTDIIRNEAQSPEAIAERPRIRTRQGIEYDPGAGFHVERLPRATVEDIMMPVAFTATEHASIAEAAALMAFEGTHRVPIVSKDGKVVGIVSSLDVLRWIAETEGYLLERPRPAGRRVPNP
jgi:CBS domain-containing protein